MPFSLVAWSESQDSATLANVAAVADQHITVSGDDVRVPQFASKLAGVYALGVNLTRAMLVSPSLRRMLNLELSPLDRAALPASTPLPIWFQDGPIELIPDENLNAQAAEDGSGAKLSTILAWLADGPIVPVTGEMFTVRVTSAVTLVANNWTNGALTFDQALQPGKYAVVGGRFLSTTLEAFRLVFPGGYFRPGGVGATAVNQLAIPGQRRGGWGVWGEFMHTTPPTADFLGTAADTAETGELDLVKTG